MKVYELIQELASLPADAEVKILMRGSKIKGEPKEEPLYNTACVYINKHNIEKIYNRFEQEFIIDLRYISNYDR